MWMGQLVIGSHSHTPQQMINVPNDVHLEYPSFFFAFSVWPLIAIRTLIFFCFISCPPNLRLVSPWAFFFKSKSWCNWSKLWFGSTSSKRMALCLKMVMGKSIIFRETFFFFKPYHLLVLALPLSLPFYNIYCFLLLICAKLANKRIGSERRDPFLLCVCVCVLHSVRKVFAF